MNGDRRIESIYLCQAYKDGGYVPAFRVRYADGSSQLHYQGAADGLYWLRRVVEVFFDKTPHAAAPDAGSQSKYAPGGLNV